MCSAEDLEQRQDLELPHEIMQALQEEAVVMSRMRVRGAKRWAAAAAAAAAMECGDGTDSSTRLDCSHSTSYLQAPSPSVAYPTLPLQHPNIVAFMGMCTLPPCILTGKQAPGGVRLALAHAPCCWQQPLRPLAAVRASLPCRVLQPRLGV